MYYKPPIDKKHLLYHQTVLEILPFLRFLKRFRLFFVLSVLIVMIASFYIYRSFQFYESRIELFINSAQAGNSISDSDDDVKFAIKQSASLKRVYQIIYSDRMFDKLNFRYNLNDIYHIPQSAFSKNALVEKVKEKVKLKTDQFDIITISVVDEEDGKRAADMANFIAQEALIMNREWYTEQLVQRMAVDSILNSELEGTVAGEKIFFEKNLAEVSRLLKNTASRDNSQLELLYRNLYSTLNRLDIHNEDYFEKFRSNGSILKTLDAKNFSEMIVIKKAIPANHSNRVSTSVFWPLIPLISVVLNVLLFYIIYRVRTFVEILKAEVN